MKKDLRERVKEQMRENTLPNVEILNAKVDWMEEYHGFPGLYVLVSKIPSYDEFLYEIKDNQVYFAEKDGIVQFGAYDFEQGGDQGGCGGYSCTIARKALSKFVPEAEIINLYTHGFQKKDYQMYQIVLRDGRWKPNGQEHYKTISWLKN